MLRMIGEFEEPDESREVKARMRHVSEPLLGFVEVRCNLGEAERVGKENCMMPIATIAPTADIMRLRKINSPSASRKSGSA